MKQINNGFKDYYYLTEACEVYNNKSKKYLSNNNTFFYLQDINNQKRKVSKKTLYKLVYNKNFCIDTIENLPSEHWKPISNTNEMYYVSDKGRIKSLYGYEAIILKPTVKENKYNRVDIVINGEMTHKYIHNLVANEFLEKPQEVFVQVHHKDFNSKNNQKENLCYLSAEEHRKIHKAKREESRKNG